MVFEFELESLKIALNSIRERKVRSGLTILGIVIGIAAIVALISTGEGARVFISSQLGGFGANKLFIGPNTQRGGGFGPPGSQETLTDKDLEDIQKVRGIDVIAPLFSRSLPVKFNDETFALPIFGIDPESSEKIFTEVQGFELENGRFFKSGEKDSVVVGSLIARKIFSKDINLRDKIEIKAKNFKVVGLLKETGQANNDNLLALPIDTLRDLAGERNEITVMLASVDDINRIEKIAEDVQKILDKNHGEKLFIVLTTTQLASNVISIFSALSIFLSGIAAIALLVAGIGITNTMFTSVLERTREIGIMKAIGATRRNILEIFLIESILIGLIGGIIGVIIGSIISEFIGGASGAFGAPLRTAVTPQLVFAGISFAVVVSVLAGLWPAWRAANLHPVEALRYE